MNKFICVLFFGIYSLYGTAFADTSTIAYPNGLWISLESHCIEKGFVRPKNPIHYICTKPFGKDDEKCRQEHFKKIMLKVPLLKIERINLGKDRVFTKASIFKTKNLKLGNGRLFSVPQCSDSLIESENSVLTERKASSQEKLVYGALWRDGIKIIDGESYQVKEIAERIEQLNERGGEKSGKSIHPLMLYYSTPNCENGEVVERDWQDFYKSGGEGSGNGFVADEKGGEGSGNGRYTWGNDDIQSESLVMNFKIQPQVYRSLSDGPTAIERWLGIRHRLHDIVSGDQEIPSSVARTRCK